jgi:hypothetical protein
LQEFQLVLGRLVPEPALDLEEAAAAEAVYVVGADVSLFFVGQGDAAALALGDITDLAFKGGLAAATGF